MSHTTYAYKRELLLWYVDQMLPHMVGFEQYGPTVRRYKMPIAQVMINGSRKPIVTVKSEAFGRVMFANCRPKWMEVLPKKLEDDDWVIPAYSKDDAATHPYHNTLWSQSRSGQVKGGGWLPGAYTKLNEYIESIKAFRKADHTNKWTVNKMILLVIRTEHGVKDKVHSRKRKRGKAKAKVVEYEEIVDVSDDEYSVHSEHSSGEC